MANDREPSRFSTMAHLFLSDLREAKGDSADNKGEDTSGHIRRVGPSGRVFSRPVSRMDELPEETVQAKMTKEEPAMHPPEPVAEAECPSCELPADEEPQESDAADKLHVLGVYCSHLHWEGNKALAEFARFLAGQGKLVGVLKLEAWSVSARVYFRHTDAPKMPSLDTRTLEPQEYGEDMSAETLATGDLASVSGIWDQLEAMREKLDYILISWGPEFGRFEEQIQRVLDSVCVIATPERKHLVSSYQFLKSLSGRELAKPLGLFVADVGSFTEAQGVFTKLAKTVRDFAGLTVENYGYSLSDGAVVQEFLSRTELRDQPETWFDGLENWLGLSRKNNTSKERSEPGMIKETSSKTNEPVRPVTPSKVPAKVTGDDSEVLMVEADLGVGKLAEVIGEKMFPEGEVTTDSLTGFLRSLGLNCAKFGLEDGRGVLVWVLTAGQDTTVPIWAAEHYPDHREQLVLITDQPFGQIEKMFWLKHFERVDVRRAIRGKFQGKDVLIIGQ